MNTRQNRFSGLFFAAFGLLLYFLVIPYDTEVVDYGMIVPQTVPNAMAWIMVIAGSVQMIWPRGDLQLEGRQSLRAAMFMAVFAVALFFIAQFGFVKTSPVLAFIIMLLVGERRPPWLFGGVVVMPLAIWLIVEILLGRTLP